MKCKGQHCYFVNTSDLDISRNSWWSTRFLLAMWCVEELIGKVYAKMECLDSSVPLTITQTHISLSPSVFSLSFFLGMTYYKAIQPFQCISETFNALVKKKHQKKKFINYKAIKSLSSVLDFNKKCNCEHYTHQKAGNVIDSMQRLHGQWLLILSTV